MKKFLIIGMSLLCASVIKADSSEKTINLRIIETSDVHGCFFPYDFIERKPLEGTLARVNTYVNRLRKDYGDRLLLLDNGDILQGQPLNYWSNFVNTNEENIAASVVNYMRYDAQTIGNHDIETGHQVYDKWIKEVRCPMLGANIIQTETGKSYVEPYTIIEREGVKIAIIGMLTPAIPCWLHESIWEGLTFQEMVSSARKWIKYVKDIEHADIVLGLFHSGKDGGIMLDNGIEENATARIAREVPGFDIIFYGHDHTRNKEWIVNSAGEKVLILDPANRSTHISDASIKLTIKDGKIIHKSINGELVNICQEKIDEDMINHFQKQIESVKQFADRRICRFDYTITTRDSYFGNSAFTDFIHNMMLKISKADISFNAPLSFDSSIKAGDITVADMFNLYKYENKLYVLKMTGKEIKDYLEESYARWVNTMQNANDHLLLLQETKTDGQQHMRFKNFSFNFDSASGIDYEVDVTKPDGQKIRILCLSNGEPFYENKTYKVAMNSYRGNGGGELITKGAGIATDKIEERIIHKYPLDLRHYMMEEMQQMEHIKPRPNNNWKFVPEAWTIPAAQRDRQLLFGE
ncbi:bifunctional metallophosphatase/5'-nucleotidase [Prevotella sp. E13-17]|uniref:bifunctional metallophosphatase/5'-nucleotidase n=1 Tax=Prevotella sp. E13-17 TaxID=2913616 RepID=UPI001EDC4D6E|nr:bifunctional metallophosphatase/5'-nucleotidase [Prevotella sp. E13-17]UKK51913.1 bifunctional metallophosphatase/5'-nucleotidase [Prevotella sp. E13-17]